MAQRNQAKPPTSVEEPITASSTDTVVSANNHSSSGKRKNFHTSRRFEKKPRNSAFVKQDMAPSLSMIPCKQFYPIFTASSELPAITDQVFAAIHARVKTVHSVIDEQLFRYVVSIAWYARMISINVACGTKFPKGASDIKRAAQGLQLPIVICQYVETLGRVKMQNGITVIPYVDDYRTLIPEGSEYFYDPLEAIQEARRQDPNNEWSIDYEWLAHYNTTAIPKLMRSGIELRSILHETQDGKSELLVGYEESSELVTPYCPERQTLSVAHKGAAYRLRNYSDRELWPFGDNEALTPLFSCENISPNLVLAELVTDSLQPST